MPVNLPNSDWFIRPQLPIEILIGMESLHGGRTANEKAHCQWIAKIFPHRQVNHHWPPQLQQAIALSSLHPKLPRRLQYAVFGSSGFISQDHFCPGNHFFKVNLNRPVHKFAIDIGKGIR